MLRKAKKGHVTSVDPKKGRLGSKLNDDAQKAAKAAAKKRLAKRKTPPKPHEETSITRGIYRLFDIHTPAMTTLEMCVAVAKVIKPDTKFDKWHLYYHRKVYKQLVANGEDPYNQIGIRPKGEVYIDEKGVARLDKSKAPVTKKVKIKKTGRGPLPTPSTGPKSLAEFFAMEQAAAAAAKKG